MEYTLFTKLRNERAMALDPRARAKMAGIDGILLKSCNVVFQGGKHVIKFANTSNRGRVCLVYQNETTISWSCKMYISSFGKIHVMTVCHENV